MKLHLITLAFAIFSLVGCKTTGINSQDTLTNNGVDEEVHLTWEKARVAFVFNDPAKGHETV